MEARGADKRLTSDQHHSLEARQVDQDRTLVAMHDLEAALSRAAPRREGEWRSSVITALSMLESAMQEEAANAERPDSLLSDLARTQPWLRNRARALRLHYGALCESIRTLRSEIESRPDAGEDFVRLRLRLDKVLTALRRQRARESDLIYEAYYDAFRVELRSDALPGGGSQG